MYSTTNSNVRAPGIQARIPEIAHTADPEKAVERCLSEGGVIMSGVFDIDQFDENLTQTGLGRLRQSLAGPSAKHEAAVQEVVASIGVLRGLQAAMTARRLPVFNCLGFPGFSLGSHLVPHVDDAFVTEGISLLTPRSHIGHICLYRDEDFTIGPYGKTHTGDLARHTKRIPSGGTVPQSHSNYYRSDVLLLRQDIPKLGFRAKVHAATSKKAKSDTSERRDLIVFDHYVSFDDLCNTAR